MMHRPRLPHLALLFTVAMLVACASVLPSCSTLSNPDNRIAQQIAVQYATGKFIEAPNATDSKLARARQVKAVAEHLKGVAGGGSATIAELHELAMSKVAKANLTTADRLLATTLVEVAVAELSQRVTTGVLSPDAVVAVNRLLDWVISAASVYG